MTRSWRIVGLIVLASAARVAASAASQTIAFDAILNQFFGISPFAIAAQASSGLPVTFQSTTPAVCKTASNLVTLLSVGPCFITASQSGNGSYSAATPAVQSFTVNQAKPSGALMAAPGSPIAAGQRPSAVVVGDFNGDGIPDLAVADSDSALGEPCCSGVTVLLGDGSGGFAPAPGSPIAAPASGLVTGDFNGDGILDLATSGGSILLGNGSGGFTSAAGSPYPALSGALVVGDFNGDGIQDLASVNYSGNAVAVLLGNGSGGFTAAPGSPFAVGSAPISIAAWDFNGDGFQDLATANSQSGNVTVLLGNGSGGFTQAAGSPFAAGSGPSCLAVGDFNMDGVPDLAIGNENESDVTVLLGTGSGGFTAASGSPFSGIAFPASILVGDFNGDGFPDLALGGAMNQIVAVFLGNGSGGFTLSGYSYFSGVNDANSLALGDFNGDGIADVAAANFCCFAGTVNTVSVPLGGPTATSAVLSATSPPTINAGQSVPLTLTVSAYTAFSPPTGTATFSDGTTVLGTASQSGSPFTFTAAGLGAGSHMLTATYSGDARTTGSSSNTITIQVNLLAQTITSAPLSNAAFGSGTVALLATATSGLGVSFASTTMGACTVAANIVTLVSVGPCSITASQAGNADYAAAANVVQGFSVTAAAQTITFGTLSNVAYGSGNVSLTATASSGLAVSFGSTTPAVCTVAGNVATLVSAGLCSVGASQAGNATYAAAPSVLRSFSVNQATQTIAFGPLANAAITTGSATLTATATSGLPASFSSANTGVCTIAGNSVTLVSVGACSITASQAGNANYSAAANVLQGFTVTQGSQTISFGPLSSVALGSAPVVLATTTTSGLAVSFASLTGGICTVAGNLVTEVNVGLCSIVASQGGNANYAPAANAIQSFNVTQEAQTISFAPLGNVGFGSGTVTLAAAATSGLAVSFASTMQGVCTVAANVVTLVNVGTCSIVASQPGNTSYVAASVTQSFVVTPGIQIITFGAPGSAALGSGPVALAATASSGLAVGFTSTTQAVCTVAGNLVTLVSAGTCSITANLGGTANYLPATSVTRSFTVTPPSIKPSEAGIFRQNFAWLLDANGNRTYDGAGTGGDYFYANFVPAQTGDVPVVGDWSGSGTTKIGIYRPSTGQWFLDYNGNGVFDAGDKTYQFGGIAGDKPVVGDWSGSGFAKIGIFRSGYFWLLDYNGDGSFDNGDQAFAFGGVAGDVPIAGDWTGDGKAKVGVVRVFFPGGTPAFWILDANNDHAIDSGDLVFAFGGIAGDVPVAGDWNGTGYAKAGMYRDGFFWVVDNNGSAPTVLGRSQVVAFGFGGLAGDVPVVGKW